MESLCPPFVWLSPCWHYYPIKYPLFFTPLILFHFSASATTFCPCCSKHLSAARAIWALVLLLVFCISCHFCLLLIISCCCVVAVTTLMSYLFCASLVSLFCCLEPNSKGFCEVIFKRQLEKVGLIINSLFLQKLVLRKTDTPFQMLNFSKSLLGNFQKGYFFYRVFYRVYLR